MDYSRIVFSTSEQLEKNNDQKPLVVTNCGCYIAHNKSAYYKSASNPNEYLLLYLHKGRIQLTQKGNRIIHGGTVLIFPPSKLICYRFLEDETNERYYVYFKGTHIANYINQFLLDDPSGIYTIGESKTLISYFFEIMNDFKIHNFETDIFRTTILLRLLNHIHRKLPLVVKETKEKEDLYLIIEHMEKNYWKQFSLEQYAKLFNMSIPTLMRKFKKKLNTTPHAYINSIRLTQSQNLLLTTNLSVAEISLQVGFIDTLYFCKFFKKQTRKSPSEYRKIFTPPPFGDLSN